MQIASNTNAAPPFQAGPAASMQAENTTTSSSAGSNPGTATATITANDFFQLLVTELQNQDPTANTDPSKYVDQLVQVNTLQQQIQMNQTLDGGPTLTGGGNGVLQELTQMKQALTGDLSSAGTTVEMSRSATNTPHAETPAAAPVGNLSIGASTRGSAAAEAVATALTRNPNHAPPAGPASAFEQFAARLIAQAK